MSGFSFRPSWGNSLNWVPSGETARDLDETSPASIDRHMGRIKREMGGETTPDFDRMRREIRGSRSPRPSSETPGETPGG